MPSTTNPSSATIRQGIVTLLKGVEGIGVVHPYRRHTFNPVEFQQFFSIEHPEKPGLRQLNGWDVTRLRFQEREVDEGFSFPSLEGYEIRGFFGLVDADATEIEFQDLIDRIRDAFRGDQDLVFIEHPENDLPSEQAIPSGDIGWTRIGDVLAHTTTLSVDVRQKHCVLPG